MNLMRHWINLVESIDDIIPGELPEYNTLAKQLKAVQKNGRAIIHILNPSEKVQLAAVQQDGYSIADIKNPCEQVQLAAVKENSWSIKYIENPSIAVQRAAVLKSPVWALNAMINRNFPISKMIQWTAAKQIKERNLIIDKDMLDHLDLDVQKYLSNEL